MYSIFNTIYSSKRKIIFYLSLDIHKKKFIGKNFCINLLKDKFSMFNEDLTQFIFKNNICDIIQFKENMNQNFIHDMSPSMNESSDCIKNEYNPFSKLEKSVDIDNIEYDKLNIFHYFSNYTNFVSSFCKLNMDSDKITKRETDVFIKSLCNVYIAHNIHLRINNEISKKTNLYILKGDYFFSLGYDKVAKLGSRGLIKIYSRISEYFARSIFYWKNYVDHKDEYEKLYTHFIIQKFVGLVYYGCSGLSEILEYDEKLKSTNFSELIKEFSFKYGILLFLREELAFLKNKTYEYYINGEDLKHLFLFFFENNSDVINNKMELSKYLSNDKYIGKYKNYANKICSDLYEIIDELSINLIEINHGSHNIYQMKQYLKIIYNDIENLVKI